VLQVYLRAAGKKDVEMQGKVKVVLVVEAGFGHSERCRNTCVGRSARDELVATSIVRRNVCCSKDNEES
jgi:hypothetical protein